MTSLFPHAAEREGEAPDDLSRRARPIASAKSFRHFERRGGGGGGGRAIRDTVAARVYEKSRGRESRGWIMKRIIVASTTADTC